MKRSRTAQTRRLNSTWSPSGSAGCPAGKVERRLVMIGVRLPEEGTLSAEYFRRRVSAICFSANCWSTFSRTPLKISGFPTNFAAAKMNRSGSRKNSASRDCRQKTEFTLRERPAQRCVGQIQDHQVSGVRDRRLYLARRHPEITSAPCWSATRVQMGSSFPAESDPASQKNSWQHRRAIAKAQVYYVSLYQLTRENQRQMGLWDHAGGHEALPVGQACVCRPDQIHRVDAR